MKKTLLVFVFIFGCTLFSTQAQNYKLNKQVYDYKMYIPQLGDSYNPALMGLSSFFIPGLGQMLSGEVGRGLGFLGGSILATTVTYVGLLSGMRTDPYCNVVNSDPNLGLLIGGSLATLGISIWSIVDATRVAKVNNMYFQDLRKQNGVSLELTPYVDSYNYLGQVNTSGGLSLTVKF